MILSKPNHIKIYGHRGARGDLPENTLESFKYLFENDINAYETDILISKDLIPVITHDFRLDPSLTKDNEGNWIEDENIKIFDLTYEELLKFDVGSLNKLSRYGRRFVKNDLAYHFAGGISYSNYKDIKQDVVITEYNFVGFPLEFGIHWFHSKKERNSKAMEDFGQSCPSRMCRDAFFKLVCPNISRNIFFSSVI